MKPKALSKRSASKGLFFVAALSVAPFIGCATHADPRDPLVYRPQSRVAFPQPR